MNVVKKLLIAHGDQKIRRRLVLLLADAGYDLRAFGSADAAAESARNEWFDLAVIDYELSGTRDFSFVEMLKKIQPTVPVILFVQQFELPIIVKGIRVGVSDVMSQADIMSAPRRVAMLLSPDAPAPADSEGVTSADLAEVEIVLDRITSREATSSSSNSPDHAVSNLPAELLRGAKERAMLEAKNARIEVEKAAIEAELKTLLSQLADAGRLEAESAEIHSQLEIAAAAQAAIDAKARQLAETRAEIARERTELEEHRRVVDKTDDELAKERAETEAKRAELQQEEDRIREEAARLQHESVKLARERRRWHDDLDLLREQEKNLRDYEVRLRQVQAQLEADRVLWFSARGTPTNSPFANDSALKEAWQKLQRATELLEAERANFRDEKLLFAEHEAELRRREEKLKEHIAKIEARNALPPPPPAEVSVGVAAVRSITRAPLEVAKAVFSGKKTE